MSENTVRKYSVAWLGGIPLAILNAFARNYLYGPHMSELTAHQVSTVTGVILIFGYYVMGNPWSRLLHDYFLLEGRVWTLFVLNLIASPMIIYKLEGGKSRSRN